jgi:DMSO/TMAO reductase YedYZ molybdopterin-dependent catalytic subunit
MAADRFGRGGSRAAGERDHTFKQEKQLTRILRIKRLLAFALILAGLACLGTAGGLFFLTDRVSDISTTWQVSLYGADGQTRTLSYQEVKTLATYSGSGGFFTTTGAVNGPYQAKGVTLERLCALVGGLQPSNLVKVSAADGYSTMLDYKQVMGNFITYDPATLKEKEHGELKPVLIFEQDGQPLSEDYGKPLRLAIVGKDGLLTEGLYWIKWINRIDVIQPKPAAGSGT